MEPTHVLYDEVEDDLREILSYIADDNFDAAVSMLLRFEEAFELIGGNPYVGHIRDALIRRLRFWPVGEYLVVYDPAPRPVEIVAVVHGRRGPSGLTRLLTERHGPNA